MSSTRKITLFLKLDEYIKWVKIHKKKYKYKEELRHCQHFKEYFENDTTLSNMKRYHILDYKAWRKNVPFTDRIFDVKPATINKEICTLSFFFNWCIEREYLDKNPVFHCKGRENNERVVSLTQEQIEELLEKANDYIYRIVIITLNTGLRASEICQLQWGNINLKQSILSLDPQMTKSKRRRTITIPDFLLNCIMFSSFFHKVKV
jgi:integrase